jgi:hypothetical protein
MTLGQLATAVHDAEENGDDVTLLQCFDELERRGGNRNSTMTIFMEFYRHQWTKRAILQKGEVMGYPVDESDFAGDVRRELARARANHSPMNSLHEAYSVILEELDELWEQVRLKREERHRGQIYRELVQISAMAERAATDLNLPRLLHKSEYQNAEFAEKYFADSK